MDERFGGTLVGLEIGAGAACFGGAETSAGEGSGQVRKTPWRRSARLQREAARLVRGREQPKEVVRFVSRAACEAGTANLNRNRK